MAIRDKQKQYEAIKSMFESNRVKKMRDIEKLFPTMIANDLKMNHSRYVKKLYKPEDFTIKQILKMALLLDVSPKLIVDVIITELLAKKTARKDSKSNE